jgi:SAM-dependent MidA family methyltransferase
MHFPPQNIAGLPEPDKASAEHSRQVVAEIRRVIDEHAGAIPFSNFMQLALYAPALGYYVAGQRRFGSGGDFVTAPELGSLFAGCLANQVAEIFTNLEGRASILEFGAGSGALACGLLAKLASLDSLPDEYIILELSPDLRARQRERLQQQVPGFVDRVIWIDRIPETSLTGVILANEVLDAMPVEMFSIDESGKVHQAMVVNEGQGFAWDSRPADEQLASTVGALGLPPGYSSEFNPSIEGWVSSLSDVLAQGVVLLIDYGFPRHEYYHPRRSGGTLMCHYRHHAHADPLVRVGIQDITAHVDFTAVAEAAVAAGLDVRGYTTQAHFLLGCGLTDSIDDKIDMQERAVLNHEIQQLTSPAEMGELFKVIALGRDYEPPLCGFRMRDMRGAL